MSKLNNDCNRNFLVNHVVLHNIIHGKVVGEYDQYQITSFDKRNSEYIFFSLIAVNYEARDFGVKRGK